MQDRLVQFVRRGWRSLDRRPAGRVLRRGIIGAITGMASCAGGLARWRREQTVAGRLRWDRWRREQILAWWICWRDLRHACREQKLRIGTVRARVVRGVRLLMRCARLIVPAYSVRVAAFVVRAGRRPVLRKTAL